MVVRGIVEVSLCISSMVPYPARMSLLANFIALIARTLCRNSPAIFLHMLSALLSNAPALASLTAACADLVHTFCANHGWFLQKALFNSSNNVLFLRIAFSRSPLYSLSMIGFGSYRE